MMLAAVAFGYATALSNMWRCIAAQPNQSTWQGSPTTELLLNGAVAT